MICENCHEKASHIFSSDRGEHCEHCSNLSISSATKSDGVLSRNSFRVRRQQSRYEGDMVTPHIYDKSAHRMKVNPDFVKLYPNQVKEFFSPEQLKNEGYKDMPKHIDKNTERRERQKAKIKNDTIFSGSSKRAITNFLKG